MGNCYDIIFFIFVLNIYKFIWIKKFKLESFDIMG